VGLTENTATALLAQNGLDVRPNSAVSVEGMEAGLVEEDRARKEGLRVSE
jgi:hypothetical protein